ncbi:MAG: hypothetical protein HKN20_08670 [Gemmatimonadetes bacterium]|nr:hypothetical protein [Gemmatimonadota bacterium]
MSGMRTLLLYGILFVLLTLSFVRNQWGVVETSWFYKHQLYAESLVFGRIVKANQDGFFSSGMLPGWVGPVPESEEVKYWQYEAYKDDLPFETYEPYRSHPSWHVAAFVFLDAVSPFSKERNIPVFHLVNSMMLACTLLLFVGLVAREIGKAAGILVFLSILFSPWITVFSWNSWWVLWAYFVPFFACWYLVRGGAPALKRVALWIFAAALFKCVMTGYEYVTTAYGMMLVPMAYFAAKDRWGWGAWTKRVFTAAGVSVVATLVSMAILVTENASESGSLRTGVDHIVETVARRAYGSDTAKYTNFPGPKAQKMIESLEASTWETVVPYFGGVAYDFSEMLGPAFSWTKAPFGAVVLLALALTLATFFTGRLREDRRAVAMAAAVWWGFVSSISWLVLFKAHSHVHYHINYIVWHLPFVMFVFAQLGCVLQGAMANRRAPDSETRERRAS